MPTLLKTEANSHTPVADAPGWLKPEELAQIQSLELRARGIVEGFLQGLHRSPFVGYSVEFSSHRKYGAGDDLRHVNWKIFAKQRKLYVKEFDAETNLNLYLWVDCSRSMECRIEGALSKLEYAATLAAAIASIAIRQHDAVALGMLADGVRKYLEPTARPGRWEECLHLLSTPPVTKATDLGKSLEQASALARHRGLVIIFSDLVDDAAHVERGIQQLRHRGHEVVIFHLLDPWERQLTKKGKMRFVCLEWNSNVTTDVESIRAAYVQRVENWCVQLEDICIRQSADFIQITTDRSPTAALVDYLVLRAR